MGARREVRGVHAIEVVDIVAAHEEQQGAGEELERIAHPIKILHRGCRPKAHGVVEPKGRAGGGVQDGAVVRRHLLALCWASRAAMST